jgi:hypothetical protein
MSPVSLSVSIIPSTGHVTGEKLCSYCHAIAMSLWGSRSPGGPLAAASACEDFDGLFFLLPCPGNSGTSVLRHDKIEVRGSSPPASGAGVEASVD